MKKKKTFCSPIHNVKFFKMTSDMLYYDIVNKSSFCIHRIFYKSFFCALLKKKKTAKKDCEICIMYDDRKNSSVVSICLNLLFAVAAELLDFVLVTSFAFHICTIVQLLFIVLTSIETPIKTDNDNFELLLHYRMKIFANYIIYFVFQYIMYYNSHVSLNISHPKPQLLAKSIRIIPFFLIEFSEDLY